MSLTNNTMFLVKKNFSSKFHTDTPFEISTIYKVIAIILFLLSIVSVDTFLLLFGALSFFAIGKFLFANRLTYAIGFAFSYQWLQINIKAIYATTAGKSLSSLAVFPDRIVSAYICANVCLIILIYVIYTALSNSTIISYNVLYTHIKKYSPEKVIKAYLIFICASFVIGILPKPGGLTQIIRHFLSIEFIFIFLMFGTNLINFSSKSKYIFYGIILFIFMSSFVNYFSSFKNVFFQLMLCSICLLQIKQKVFIKLVISCFVLLYFGCVWHGIKSEYRRFLNDGQSAQVIVVNKTEAFEKFIHLVSNNFIIKENTIESLIMRLSYIDFLSGVMSHVPKNVPYANGKQFARVISHIFLPRIINHNKEIYDDSADLSYYTGRQYAGLAEGSSAGMGWLAYMYVDGGILAMVIGVIIYGLIIALCFRSVSETSPNELFVIASICLLSLTIMRFETSLIKQVGALVIRTIVLVILNVKFFPWLEISLKHKNFSNIVSTNA